MKSKNILIILMMMVSTASFAQGQNTCAYKAATGLLQIIKETVGLRSPAQLEAVKQYIKTGCIEESDSQVDQALNQAVTDLFGDKGKSFLGSNANKSPKDIQADALAGLHSTLKLSFKDPDLKIDDTTKLHSKDNTYQSQNSKTEVKSILLSGALVLSNEWNCEVLAQADLHHEGTACTVKTSCSKGTKFKVYNVQRSCEALKIKALELH